VSLSGNVQALFYFYLGLVFVPAVIFLIENSALPTKIKKWIVIAHSTANIMCFEVHILCVLKLSFQNTQ